MALELSVSLSPIPLPADVPADVTLELILRNTGDEPELVFPEAAAFHEGGGLPGPLFDSANLHYPMKIWNDGMKSVPPEWYAARSRRLEPGAVATRSVSCCWIPRGFVALPGAEASYIAFDHSAKWAPQFRRKFLDEKGHPIGHESPASLNYRGSLTPRRDGAGKTPYLFFAGPGRHDVAFEYLHRERDLALLGVPAPLRLVSRPMVLEIP